MQTGFYSMEFYISTIKFLFRKWLIQNGQQNLLGYFFHFCLQTNVAKNNNYTRHCKNDRNSDLINSLRPRVFYHTASGHITPFSRGFYTFLFQPVAQTFPVRDSRSDISHDIKSPPKVPKLSWLA